MEAVQKEQNLKKEIVLRWNPGPPKEAHCVFCNSVLFPDGLDFFVKGTKDFVCGECVNEKAPEQLQIHEEAHRWADDQKSKRFSEGIAEGKRIAGQLIKQALCESQLDRVQRVCVAELGWKNFEFTNDDMPF